MPYKALEPESEGIFFSQPRWGKKAKNDVEDEKK